MVSSRTGRMFAASQHRSRVCSRLRRSPRCWLTRRCSKSVREMQVELVGGVERGSADDLGELADLPGAGERGEQLRGEFEVVVAGASRPGAAAHQPRQRRQRVDGWVDAACVHVRGKHDLALGDVAGEIRHGMGDVAGGHGQHRQHGHRAGPAADAPAPLVQRGEVAVQVAGVGPPAGHLASRRRDLAQRFGVAGHVGEHDEHVPVEFEREVFGDGQRDAWRQDPLDHRVVGGVEQQQQLAGRGALLEGGANGIRVGVGEPHRGEDDAERLVARGRLGGDLGGEFEVRQPGDREDRQLLTADERGERVDRGDAGQDRVGRRLAVRRVERVAGDRRCGRCRRSVGRRRSVRRARCRPVPASRGRPGPVAARRRRRPGRCPGPARRCLREPARRPGRGRPPGPARAVRVPRCRRMPCGSPRTRPSRRPDTSRSTSSGPRSLGHAGVLDSEPCGLVRGDAHCSPARTLSICSRRVDDALGIVRAMSPGPRAAAGRSRVPRSRPRRCRDRPTRRTGRRPRARRR